MMKKDVGGRGIQAKRGNGGMEGWRDGGMEGWRDKGMKGCRDGGMEGWRGRALRCISL